MGGYGSGYQGPQKSTVEDALTLSISTMMKQGALQPGAFRSGVWCWSYPSDEPHARITYIADMRSAEAATLRLMYEVDGQAMDYVMHLVCTEPNFGGRRWWFLCPIDDGTQGAPRRAAKLYLPPGARYFGSRQAYNLTYTSCQASGKFDALYARVARDMATDVAVVRRAMKAMAAD